MFLRMTMTLRAQVGMAHLENIGKQKTGSNQKERGKRKSIEKLKIGTEGKKKNKDELRIGRIEMISAVLAVQPWGLSVCSHLSALFRVMNGTGTGNVTMILYWNVPKGPATATSTFRIKK